MAEKFTTMECSCATRDRIKSLAQKDETYDEFLNRMADVFVKAKK